MLDLILWIAAAGSIAAPVNGLVALGRNIDSALTWLLADPTKTEATRRFLELAPVASVVQKRVCGRVLFFALALITAVGVIVILTGRFTPSSFDWKDGVDVLVVTGAAAFSFAFFRFKAVQRLFGSDDEVAILREYGYCYAAYLQEKRNGFKIPNELGYRILETLQLERESKSIEELANYLKNPADNLLPNMESIKRELKWLKTSGYVEKSLFGKKYKSIKYK